MLFTFDLPIDLASAIVGLLLALGLYVFDKSVEPDLQVSVAEPSKLPLKQGEFKSLNLKITNTKKIGALKFLNRTATQIRVRLEFLDFHSKVSMNTIVARWNSSREPVTPDYKKVDIGLALVPPREVLVPGEESTISVVIRKKDNKYCFPFNNYSYLYQEKDFETEGWKIDDDKFIVKVKIQSAEIDKIGGEFVVLNKSTLEQFKIEK